MSKGAFLLHSSFITDWDYMIITNYWATDRKSGEER